MKVINKIRQRRNERHNYSTYMDDLTHRNAANNAAVRNNIAHEYWIKNNTLTKREQFVAAALTGILACTSAYGYAYNSRDRAKVILEHADAVMEALGIGE